MSQVHDCKHVYVPGGSTALMAHVEMQVCGSNFWLAGYCLVPSKLTLQNVQVPGHSRRCLTTVVHTKQLLGAQLPSPAVSQAGALSQQVWTMVCNTILFHAQLRQQ